MQGDNLITIRGNNLDPNHTLAKISSSEEEDQLRGQMLRYLEEYLRISLLFGVENNFLNTKIASQKENVDTFVERGYRESEVKR